VADVELAPATIREDLHQDPVTVAELGFKVIRHWSDVPAVSERDAGREQVSHAAYAEELAGRMGGEAHAEARNAGSAGGGACLRAKERARATRDPFGDQD
jgi:hypothetical protein